VIIDLKIGKFTHTDAGQTHLYLNYARERWVHEGENPPVGLILCAQKDEAVARYALEGLPNKVMASDYRTAQPDENELAAEIERTQVMLQGRKRIALTSSEMDRMKQKNEKVAEGKRQQWRQKSISKKMLALYQDLAGAGFKQKIEDIVEAFSSMQDQLNKERQAMVHHC